MVVKCFTKRHNLTGSGRGDHLTSYSFVLMVIFFLQSEGILHPLNILQNVPGVENIIIDGFNVAFSTDRSQLPPLQPNNSSLTDFLRNFFEYFTLFDFENNVICPLLGSPVLRDNLRTGVDLPDCLHNYNRGQGRLKLETTIVIQDPFELTRNVSGNLSVRKLDRIVTMFRAAALVLGVVVRNNFGANMDTVFRLLFTPGFQMTEEFSKLIEE